MGKIILIVLVALGVGLYFPESRAVMVEHSRPLLDPFHRWVTHQELGRIVDDLEQMRGVGDGLPTRAEAFEAWMERRYQQASSRVDSWGTPYRLEVHADSFYVVSAGPDQEFGTDGDLRRSGRTPVR